MANRIEIHLADGEKIIADAAVSGLGRSNMGPIQLTEDGSDTATLYVNPEHITFVRDHGPKRT